MNNPVPPRMLARVAATLRRADCRKRLTTARIQDVLSSDCSGLTYETQKISADRSCHEVNSPLAASDPSPAEQKLVDFILYHKPSEKALWRAKLAILDTCAVAAAGQGFPSSKRARICVPRFFRP
jgi:hypothetical protein